MKVDINDTFSGFLTDSKDGYTRFLSDLSGNHLILQPLNISDVAQALNFADQLGRNAAVPVNVPVFIKSGTQANFSEIKSAAGGAVIDLQYLRALNFDDEAGVVHAEPGVPMRKLVRRLAEDGWVVPLNIGENQSVAAAVIDDELSDLVRTLGPVKVEGVDAVFPGAEIKSLGSLQAFYGAQRAATGVEPAAVSFTLKASKTDGLWMSRCTVFPPQGDSLEKLIRSLLPTQKESAEERWQGVDVAIRVHPMVGNLPILTVQLIGREEEKRMHAEEYIRSAFSDNGTDTDQFSSSFERYSGRDVMDALIENSQTASMDVSIKSLKKKQVQQANESSDSFISKISPLLSPWRLWDYPEAAEADGAETEMNSSPGDSLVDMKDLSRDVRVQLDSDGRLYLYGYAYQDADLVSLNKAAARAKDGDTPPKKDAPPKPPSIIDDFDGDELLPGSENYETRVFYYADESVETARLTPELFCQPHHVKDIQRALAYASRADVNWKVTPRSGGHQFSGLSGGGKDTLVVDMAQFNYVKEGGEGNENTLFVGAAVTLGTLVNWFRAKGFGLPHGECSQVAVGGHGQTGGYGHMTRGLGLFQDHIQSFKIVLACGADRHVKASDDDELFWAVLGGNAGSWGVVYEYELKCIPNDSPKHAGSDRYIGVQKYTRERYERVAKTFEAWVEEAKGGRLSPQRDLFMTIISGSKGTFDIISINNTNTTAIEDDTKDRPELSRDHISKAIKYPEPRNPQWDYPPRPNSPYEHVRPVRPLSFVLPVPLSELSHRSVRNSYIMPRSVEFLRPYVRFSVCWSDLIPNGFMDEVVDLTSDVMIAKNRDMGLRLSTELWVGGASYQDPNRRSREHGVTTPSRTAMPQRNQLFGFTFDVFYDADSRNSPINESKQEAEKYNKKIREIAAKYFKSKVKLGPRMFWGTHGKYPEEYDMTDSDVSDAYYDNSEDFEQLRKLKKKYDPNNLFQTIFTVPPL